MKAAAFTARIMSPDCLSDTDREAWRAFLAPQSIAFLSYEYAARVASCIPRVRVCRIAHNGRPVAFFPFQYRSALHAMTGIAERLGGDLSDYFGLVAEPGFHIEPAAFLKLCGINSLFFSHLDDSQRTNGLTASSEEIGYRIDLPQGGDAYWEDKRRTDKKFVSDTERRERKLVQTHGELSFTYAATKPQQALARLIAAKRAQYARRRVTDVLAKESTRSILHALCEAGDPQCTGVVSTLHAGETWVASHFGLKSGRTLHYWFPVYNPELKAFAPGRILLKQVILAAQDIAVIDRGAGDSVAKRDLATSHHLFGSGLWQRSGTAALAHRLGIALQWRAEYFLSRRNHEPD